MPRELRKRFKIEPGTKLHWRDAGGEIRVVKLASGKKGRFFEAIEKIGEAPTAPLSTNGVEWLRRLGRIPAVPRSKELVRYDT